jgi:small subunit ribosomal protein S17
MALAARTTQRRTMEGIVVSDRMTHTITVKVTRSFRHTKYAKIVRKAKKYMAHDERDEAKVGDRVEIVECRPLSRNKRWRLLRVLARGAAVTGHVDTIEQA